MLIADNLIELTKIMLLQSKPIFTYLNNKKAIKTLPASTIQSLVF